MAITTAPALTTAPGNLQSLTGSFAAGDVAITDGYYGAGDQGSGQY